MSKRSTSRDELIDIAYAIAQRHGLAALSMRGLAGEAGVAVGTVYNYFPAKEDLTVAVAERYFERAFFQDFCHPNPDEGFVDYCARMYTAMRAALATFRAEWLADAASLPVAEKAAARLHESQRLDHIEQGLARVFDRDPLVRRAALPPSIGAADVAHFVLDNVLGALRRHDEDCPVLFALLRAGLYGNGDAA